MAQQPGWYNVPGKGERYWNGKSYGFYGPSDTAASKGQGKVSTDIGGMWNNFVSQFGSTTSDSSKVGLLPHQKAGFETREEHLKALKKKREGLKNGDVETVAKTKPTKSRTGNVDTPTPYPTEAVTKTIKPSRDYQQESGSGGSGERTSSEGVVQKGQTLGGVNNILKGFGAGELADVSTAYQSAALPSTLSGVAQLEKPLFADMEFDTGLDVSYTDDPAVRYGTELPEGTPSFASTSSYTPYSTGSNPDNAQDGASPKPDRVERLRQVAFNGADFSGDEPDDSTLTSPTQSNPMRNQIRAIYGDDSLSIAQQSAKVSALTGVYRYGGKGYANVGGELVEASEGNNRSLLNARGGGVDPSEFLQTKLAEVKETATDTSETTTAPTESTFKPVWKTKAVPDSGAPAGGWDKHFADMEKNR